MSCNKVSSEDKGKNVPIEPNERNPDELKQLHDDYFLCLQVLLDDMSNSKPLEKSALNSDLAVAAQIVREECINWIDSFRLAHAIECSGSIPDSMATAFALDSAQEYNDRQMALKLANLRDRNAAETHDKNLLAAFGNLQIDESFVASTSQETCSMIASCSKNAGDSSSGHCISCFESAKLKSVCGHYYCNSCITQLCLNAIQDISLFPVRCCKENIQQELVDSALNDKDLKRYKALQLSISSLTIKSLDPEFKKMVLANGWKICPGCGAGIEKTRDCNHMTCLICKFQFCYVCNAHWVPRRCKCDLWLPQELEAILDERAPNANVVERERLRNVYRQHDVHVHRWNKLWINNRYVRCPQCNWVCNQWYWRCNECVTNSCGRCAFNRH